MAKSKSSKSSGKSGGKSAKILLALIRRPERFVELLDEFEELNRDFYLDYRESFLQTVDELRAMLNAPDDAAIAARLPQLPGPFQEALLEWAVEESRVEFVAKALADANDKTLKRSLKQLAHRLKTKGLSIEKEAKSAVFKTDAAPKPEPAAYASGLDGVGESVAWIAQPTTRGMRIFYAVVSHPLGIVQAAEYEGSRAEFRKQLANIRDRESITVIDVDPTYVVYTVTRAKRFAEDRKFSLPEGFLAAYQHMVSAFPVPDSHPAWGIEGAAEDTKKTELLNRGTELHERAEFRSWVPDTETLMRFEHRLRERETSALVINDRQEDDYVDSLIDQTVAGFFAEPRRSDYAERLLDMAYLLDKQGRRDDALLCLASSRALADPKQPLAAIPFAARMLTKLLKRPEDEDKKEERTDSGLIVPGR